MGLPDQTKETQFFSFQYDKGLDWYAAHFRNCAPDLPVFEICPSYFSVKTARERIAQQIPRCRIICTLRDPVERLYSHYRMTRQFSRLGDFEDALPELAKVVQASRYMEYLTEWLEAFGEANVLIALYDDLQSDPQGFINSICDFAEIARFQLAESPVGYEKVNRVTQAPRSPLLAAVASRLYFGLGSHRIYQFRNLWERSRLWRWCFSGGDWYERMKPEIEQNLRIEFRPQIELLERLIGRDLSSWKTGAERDREEGADRIASQSVIKNERPRIAAAVQVAGCTGDTLMVASARASVVESLIETENRLNTAPVEPIGTNGFSAAKAKHFKSLEADSTQTFRNGLLTQSGYNHLPGKHPLTVSVIIPTKGRPRELRTVTFALLQQTVSPRELIIVDQSPDDASYRSVEDTFATAPTRARSSVKLLYVRDSSITGAANARNRGMDQADADIWVFLDDDVEPEPDFIERLLQVYEARPEVDGVSGVITNYLPPALPFRMWSWIFVRGPFHDERQPIYWNADGLRSHPPIRVAKFGTGLMSFRARVVTQHRFDPHLSGSDPGEDVDFCLRLGPVEMLIAPEARLVHRRCFTDRPVAHWLKDHAKAMHYLYQRNWRIDFPNRVRFGWLNAGYVFAASLASMKSLSLNPWRALTRGIKDARRLAQNNVPPSTVTNRHRDELAS